MTATILGLLFGLIACLVAYIAGMAFLDIRDKTDRAVEEIAPRPVERDDRGERVRAWKKEGAA